MWVGAPDKVTGAPVRPPLTVANNECCYVTGKEGVLVYAWSPVVAMAKTIGIRICGEVGGGVEWSAVVLEVRLFVFVRQSVTGGLLVVLCPIDSFD